MSTKVKIGLYIVFTMGACLFGFLAWKHYNRLMSGVEKSAKATSDVPVLEEKATTSSFEGYSRVMTFGVFFFISVVGLGLLVGHDVSQYFGNRALRLLYNDEQAGMQDPDYEHAEQVWADGHHLEAIRLMREYLDRNPRELHVALRIAEIYEKDLHNYLAAALEYEEVLKHGLPRERWAWAGIHLCNLYLKLNQQEKMVSLLQRIESEYAETQGAEKARKRLALIESEGGLGSSVVMEENTPADGRQPS